MQDLKGIIRVYCRVCPLIGQQNNCGVVGSVEEENISLITPSKNGKELKKTFTCNKVFGPYATQGEVFSDTQPLIRIVLDGFNVCIFAYSQTGSAKTHTPRCIWFSPKVRFTNIILKILCKMGISLLSSYYMDWERKLWMLHSVEVFRKMVD
ncbi:P-loop nucleoside triphosphate hydrolase superfamily protein with CH (Calponiny) domain-containing protein [Trifolium repens]|nr:P-loop nucleoside triphosphate hydrolase superfamily protein with CH (Calponiny) domain-containing protein [Trifolium repens]